VSESRPPATEGLIDAQYAASGTIYGTDNPTEMLGAILAFAGVPYTHAHLGLLRDPAADPTAAAFVDLVAKADANTPPTATAGVRRLEEYPAYEALAAVELLHIDDVRRDRFLNDEERRRLLKRGVTALIVLPLVAQQTLIGVVQVEQVTHVPVDAVRLRSLRRLADQAAIVLQNQALLRAAQANAQALRRQVTALQTLNQMAIEVGRFTDEQALFDYVTRTVAQALAVDHAGLVVVDVDKRHGTVISEWPLTGTVGRQIDLTNNPMFDLMMAGLPNPFLIADTETDERIPLSIKQLHVNLGIRALLLLPVMARGQLVATLGLDLYTHERYFSTTDVEVAQTISAQFSVALENIRLLTETQRRAEQLQRIATFSRSVQATLELPSILRIMLSETAQMLALDRMHIALFDQRGGGLRFVGHYENDRPSVAENAAIDEKAGSSVAGEVWKKQQFVYHPDTLNLRGSRTRHDLGLRAIMGTPIRLRGRTLGAVVVGSFRPNRYSETDGALFQQLVNQFAVTLENAEAYAQSQRIARSEALVNEISLELQQSGDLQRMAEITLRQLSTALGAVQARIRLNPLEAPGDLAGALSTMTDETILRSSGPAARADGQETWE